MKSKYIVKKFERNAFTLIELLIVIAIIGILMSLLFPAIPGAIDSAKKAETAALLTTLRNAINMYETEYGFLPDVSNDEMFLSDSDSGKLLIQILTGGNPGSPPKNPRLIRFVEISPKFFDNKDPSTNKVLDSWGKPFRIGISKNYDTVDMGAGFSPSTIKTTVALASGGKKNSFTNADAVKTW